MAVVLKLLSTAFELALLASCVRGCLTLKKHINSQCRVANTMRNSGDVVTFEFTYDKPACDLIWKMHTHVCWTMTPRNQLPRDDPCEYMWSPKHDPCKPESHVGCYMAKNDTSYLRHVVDATPMAMTQLSGTPFEIIVRKAQNVFEVRNRYFSHQLEKFPRIFDKEVERLTLNDEEVALDVTSHTIMMDMYYDLEYCVFHIMKGMVSVAFDRNVTKSRPDETCVRVIFVASKKIGGSILTLT
ncbi:unnamed protein product, partial [Lymnaea stagnalis]